MEKTRHAQTTMIKLILILVITVVTLVGTDSSWGQSEVVEESVLNRVPPMSEWKIVAQKNSAVGKKRTSGVDEVSYSWFKKRTLIKTNEISKITTTWNNGIVSEDWTFQMLTFRKDPKTKVISILDPQSTSQAPRLDLSDFEGLQWLSASYFVRRESKNGKECMLYEWKERAPSTAEIAKITGQDEFSEKVGRFRGMPTQPTKVWVNESTRFPEVVADELATYTYQFQQSPTSQLSLPLEFQNALDAYNEAKKEKQSHLMPKQE